MKTSILLSLAAFILFACEQENADPFSHIEFYENHAAANWTKETAKEHLQGRWNLKYVYCCVMTERKEWQGNGNEKFELLFEGDTVKVYVDNILDQKQYWDFEDRAGEVLYLETEEYIPHTFGTIYFSEDYMLFNGSPSDATDNYFQKID
jgi:hypothetical protein